MLFLFSDSILKKPTTLAGLAHSITCQLWPSQGIIDILHHFCYDIAMTSPDHAPTPEKDLRPGSLICEPDADALAEWRRLYPEDSGKFIRVGALVLVAPGFPDPLRHEPLKHFEILYSAFQGENESLRARIREASDSNTEPTIREDGNLVDAGHYTTRVDDEGSIMAVTIWGDSYDFGRADNDGRRRTVELVQDRLAPIAVRSID